MVATARDRTFESMIVSIESVSPGSPVVLSGRLAFPTGTGLAYDSWTTDVMSWIPALARTIMTRRTRGREIALQVLYQTEQNPGLAPDEVRQFIERRLRG